MTEDMDRNLERSLGKVEGKMEALLKSVSDQSVKAAENRAHVNVQLSEMEKRLGGMESQSSDMYQDIKAMKPAFREVADWKQRLIGMRLMIWFIASAIGAAGYAAGQWISNFIKSQV